MYTPLDVCQEREAFRGRRYTTVSNHDIAGDSEPSPPGPGEQERLIRTLGSIMARRFTGLLHVTRDPKRLSLSFRDGEAVFAEERTGDKFRSEDSLARPLLQQGVLSSGQYVSIVKEMKGVSSANVDVWFCDIALRLGYLTHNQIFDAFTARIREKLIEAVGWRQYGLSLEDSPRALLGHEQYPVDPGPVLFQAIRAHFNGERVSDCLQGRFERAVTLRHSISSIARRFDLDGNEAQMLELCDGKTTVTQMVQQSVLQRQHAWQLVCLLVLSGFAELAEPAVSGRSVPTPPRPERIPTLDSLPEPESTSAAAAPPEPKRTRSEKPKPASGPAPSPGEKPSSRRPFYRDRELSRPVMQSLTRELRKRGSMTPGSSTRVSAPATSSRPASSRPSSSRPASPRPSSSGPASPRPSSSGPASAKSAPADSDSSRPQRRSHIDVLVDKIPGDSLDKLASGEALAAWESGRRLLQQSDFSSAREQFRLACKLDPRRGVYRMYFLWSARQASGGHDTEERSPNELKKLAEAHTCIEGHIGIASYILGHLALSEGNERSAERYFKDAFTYDSEMREAESQYRLLARRRRHR